MKCKYPVGIESFYDIRTEGYAYIDKTKYIYDLANSGVYFFLSRPRRFGKSLLLSTMEAYFSGKRELFKGLAIDELDSDWKSYPVLRLNLSGSFKTDGQLSAILDYHLRRWEKKYDITQLEVSSFSVRFASCIEAIYEQTGQKVVVLVDEYDQPITDTLDNPELNQKHCDMLRGFYSCLKPLNRYLKFVFIAGVSKIGMMRVLSRLSDIEDISLSSDYAAICGITDGELKWQFRDEISPFAAQGEMTQNEFIAAIRKHYDGYHFYENSPCVYHPFSVISTLKRGCAQHHWFEPEIPLFLIEYLRQNKLLVKLVDNSIDKMRLYRMPNADKDAALLMYQAGYLTIKAFDEEYQSYRLGIPNLEVEEGFYPLLLNLFYTGSDSLDSFDMGRLMRDFSSGNVEGFIEHISSFLSSCPYSIISDSEKHFQNILFILCRLCGLRVHAEYRASSKGVDMLIAMASYRYVLDFKIDQSAQIAMSEIRSKDYGLSIVSDERVTCLVGINISTETRTIDDYCVELYDSSAEKLE